ncbi:MAG TPA: hemerythrin domain-containing protein [Planctomycetota bacterium]|nr:hemerythrin domain-containing protein [Planctomycetota bacterium]
MKTHPIHSTLSRRSFFAATLVTSSALGCKSTGHDEAGEEEEVSATEDLMREHGVLERMLLVYEEIARRATRGESFDPALVIQTAQTIRRFIEDYHEKLEEQHVFPRVEKIAGLSATVAILRVQHAAGRGVTDEIEKLARAGGQDHGRLIDRIQAFSRMYRPHAAREDTLVFPALRKALGKAEILELGEAFEEEEHRRFGEGGFEAIVAEVTGLETSLGLADLALFNP